MGKSPDRAVIFIDGNNWYHLLSKMGVGDLGGLNYATISKKLAGPRDWIETRYYIGQVPQIGNSQLYASQRRFFAHLTATDPKISIHLGRLEQRPVKTSLADELGSYLANLTAKIDTAVFHELIEMAKAHRFATTMVEKAVDVMLAVDMVVMAERDQLDSAYLLSADGDFTPAVKAVREQGKKVYAVAAGPGAQLASVVNSYIRLQRDWFDGCHT